MAGRPLTTLGEACAPCWEGGGGAGSVYYVPAAPPPPRGSQTSLASTLVVVVPPSLPRRHLSLAPPVPFWPTRSPARRHVGRSFPDKEHWRRGGPPLRPLLAEPPRLCSLDRIVAAAALGHAGRYGREQGVQENWKGGRCFAQRLLHTRESCSTCSIFIFIFLQWGCIPKGGGSELLFWVLFLEEDAVDLMGASLGGGKSQVLRC